MGTNEIEIHGSKITINGTTRDAGTDIREWEDFGTYVVVRVAPEEGNPLFNRNVLAFEPDGTERWRIDRCPDETGGGHDYYGGLFGEDGDLWVYNLNGMKYRVDADDGSIIDKQFVK